jgi:ATP-binding cassette, subfamily C, bacterial LapB
VLILDEPSNDLDFESETALLQTLRQIALKHTVIVVTHSLRVASMAQHLYHVRGDGGIEHGSPQQLLPQLFGTAREAAVPAAAPAPADKAPHPDQPAVAPELAS